MSLYDQYECYLEVCEEDGINPESFDDWNSEIVYGIEEYRF